MKNKLLKLYYKIFKRYEIIERKFVTYFDADKLIKDTHHKEDESERWVLDTEREDHNKVLGMVFLCRKKRIIE